MFRFYWNNNRNETEIYKGDGREHTLIIQEIKRTNGGWWFSEETSEGRCVYEVIERTEIISGHYLELLKPLPPDFLQLPCWEEPLQHWKILRTEAQGSLKSLGDLQILEWLAESPGLVPELSLQHPGLVPGLVSGLVPGLSLQKTLSSYQKLSEFLLLEWVHKEVGHLHNILQKEMKKLLPYLYLLNQKEELYLPSTEKQKMKDVQQKYPSQTRALQKELPSQHVQLQHLEHPKYVSSSEKEKEKGLKMGSICSPSFLPDQQFSRVLVYHPSKSQKQSSQAHYKKCLIVQE